MKINKIALGLLVVCGTFLGVSKIDAATVSSPSYNITLCGSNYQYSQNCPPVAQTLVIEGNWRFNLNVSFSKTFNFILDGANTNTWFELPVNKVATVYNGPTSGWWTLNGGPNDTPPADGQWYSYLNSQVFSTAVSVPADYAWPSITSSDSSIVRCTGGGCIGVKPGTAYVTVSFPSAARATSLKTPNGNWGFGLAVVSKTQWNNQDDNVWRWRTASVAQPYELSSLTYGVVVPPLPNTPQNNSCSVSNVSTSNITSSSATINWIYSDPDSDVQTDYHVQIATSPTFEESTIVDRATKGLSGISNATSFTTNALTPDTQYYARVETHNDINSWGDGFVNCGDGFKTPPPPENGICGTTVANTCGANGELEGVYGGENISSSWWSCPGSNGGATSQCSLPKDTSSGLSCTVSDATPYIDQDVTYTAIFNPLSDVKEYKWYIGGTASGNVVGENSKYTTSYSAPDSSPNSYLRTVKVIKQDDSVVTATCPRVSVGCDPSTKIIPDEVCAPGDTSYTISVCTATGWVRTTKQCGPTGNSITPTGTFNFDPKIVNAGDTCPLYMNIQNATSCTLNNKLDNPEFYSADPVTKSIVKNGTEELRVGTYDLYCVGLGDPLPKSVYIGSQSCYSKPEIKEN